MVSLKNPANKLKCYHLMLLSKMLPIKTVSTYSGHKHIRNFAENAQEMKLTGSNLTNNETYEN